MSDPIGMGVVGAGAIGIRGALSHLSLPDVQDRVRLTAVCDPVAGRARAAAEKYGVPSAYDDYESLLGDPRVDVVTIGSPIGVHYEQGLAAIEAGKHIHFNKAMATRASECADLIVRAKKKGVRIVASPGMMLWPHNQRIRDRIHQGAIGRVVWAITGRAMGDYHLEEEFRTGEDVLTDVDPTWYFRKPAGGPLWDGTVYCLHALTGILGSARRVTALSGLALDQRQYRGRTIECDMDDTTFMLVDFGDSVFATVYGTVRGDVTKGDDPSIFGTEGSVVAGELNGESMRYEGDHMPHVIGPHARMPESHVFEDMMQLVDWVRDGTPSIVTAEHALHVIDIIESAYRSAETGETQDIRTGMPAVDCRGEGSPGDLGPARLCLRGSCPGLPSALSHE